MYILVLSDTHLGLPFESAKYHRLKELISQSTQVVINGDFWEGYAMTFDSFLTSDWRNLFPLLKERNAIYLYGNHDKKPLSDERVMQFCTQAQESYELTVAGKLFHFEHGNRLAPKYDDRHGLIRPNRFGFMFISWVGTCFVSLFGLRVMWKLYGTLNAKIKKQLPHELNHKIAWAVFGHTHCQEIDEGAHFANGGVCKYGYLQYLTISKEGALQSHEERY